MVTTTSSTSGASTTSSPSTSSTGGTKNNATNTALQELLSSLNAGSGVDTGTLVQSLVTAQFAAKNAQLSQRADTLTSQISGVSKLKSAITDFANALQNLVKGGTLQPQPTSSNADAIKASVLPGKNAANVSSTITVQQLASAQAAVSATPLASRGTVLGAGKLTLTIGAMGNGTDTIPSGKATTITLTKTDATIDDLAAAINASGAGVSASVITSADGKAYLSLKGKTGADQAFTLSAEDPNGAYGQFAVGNGSTTTTTSSAAANAKLTVDGIAVERGSNSISDLVDGVKLDLVATTSSAVSITPSTPTAALAEAVNNFVATHNEVMKIVQEQTNPIDGPLRSDPAAQNLLKSLSRMTLNQLVPNAAAGTPSTLAAIGVNTERDGTLSVNTSTLMNALQRYPDSIMSMFAYSADSKAGLSGALTTLSNDMASTMYGLGASSDKYSQQQSALATEQSRIADQTDVLATRMGKQFAAMNARVSAYKSTQAFLDQQVKAWTKSD